MIIKKKKVNKKYKCEFMTKKKYIYIYNMQNENKKKKN